MIRFWYGRGIRRGMRLSISSIAIGAKKRARIPGESGRIPEILCRLLEVRSQGSEILVRRHVGYAERCMARTGGTGGYRPMAANPYESPENPSDIPRQPSGWWRFVFPLIMVVSIVGLLVALLMPATRGVPEAGRRMQCNNHLKLIALGLHNYSDTYGSFPPAYTVDASGKPLHSWRTLILPFIEQKALYDQIDLSKPWDDPVNEAARNAKLATYVCPSGIWYKPHTTYFAVVVPGGCFKATEGTPLAAITDNKSETLMVVEVSEKYAVHGCRRPMRRKK